MGKYNACGQVRERGRGILWGVWRAWHE